MVLTLVESLPHSISEKESLQAEKVIEVEL